MMQIDDSVDEEDSKAVGDDNDEEIDSEIYGKESDEDYEKLAEDSDEGMD